MNFSWPQFEVSRLGVNRKFGWNLARRRKNGRFGFSDLVLISNSFDVWQARSIFSGRILRFQGWVSIASSAGTSPGGEKTAGLHLPPGGFEVLLVAMNLKMFVGGGAVRFDRQRDNGANRRARRDQSLEGQVAGFRE